MTATSSSSNLTYPSDCLNRRIGCHRPNGLWPYDNDADPIPMCGTVGFASLSMRRTRCRMRLHVCCRRIVAIVLLHRRHALRRIVGAGQRLLAGAGERSDELVRGVRLLDVVDVLGAQPDVQRGDRVVHAFRLRAADDRRGDAPGPVPSQSDAGHRHAEPFREPVHAFDDRHILRTCLIVLVAHGAVGGAAFGIGIPGRMGQMAGRHGEYGVSAMLY